MRKSLQQALLGSRPAKPALAGRGRPSDTQSLRWVSTQLILSSPRLYGYLVGGVKTRVYLTEKKGNFCSSEWSPPPCTQLKFKV